MTTPDPNFCESKGPWWALSRIWSLKSGSQLTWKDREIKLLRGWLEKKREKMEQLLQRLDQAQKEKRELYVKLGELGKENERLAKESEEARFRAGCAIANYDMAETLCKKLKKDQMKLSDKNEQLQNDNQSCRKTAEANRKVISRYRAIANELREENDRLSREIRLTTQDRDYLQRIFDELCEKNIQLQKESMILKKSLELLKDENGLLLDGYPEGMTPTDAKNLKEANYIMAGDLKKAQATIDVLQIDKVYYRHKFNKAKTNFKKQKEELEQLKKEYEACISLRTSDKRKLKAQEDIVKRLRVRLSNCGHYAELGLRAETGPYRRHLLENIIAEAEDPV